MTNNRLKTWLKRMVIAIVVVGIGTGGYLYYKRSTKPVANAQQNYYRVAARKGNIEVNVAASGSVSSASVQDVIAGSNGTLTELKISEGSQVKKGDVIAGIGDDAISQELQKLENDLKQQNINLTKMKDSLNDFYIKAPADGRVKSIKAKVGEDSGVTTKTYGALAVISTDGKMKMSLKADNQVALEIGEKVTVTPDGANPIEGTVEDKEPGQGNTTVTIIIGRDDFAIGTHAGAAKADGTVIGKGTLQVNSPVNVSGGNGVVSKIYVSENAKVSRGSNMFKIKDTDVQSSIQSQNLSISQTKEDLQNKKTKLDNLEITSPCDGIVTALNIKTGDNVQEGKAIATITDPGQLQVIAVVDELDISKVQIGQKAVITLDALPDQSFEGSVVKIADIGKSTNNVTTYDVTVSVDKPENIKIGMSANVQIQVAGKENVLLLPVEAIQSLNGKKFVTLASNDQAVYRNPARQTGTTTGRQGNWQDGRNSGGQGPNQRTTQGTGNRQDTNSARTITRNGMKEIQIGLMNEDFAEVTGGLQEGQEVVVYIQSSSSTTQRMNMNPFGGGAGGAVRIQSGGPRPSEK